MKLNSERQQREARGNMERSLVIEGNKWSREKSRFEKDNVFVIT